MCKINNIISRNNSFLVSLCVHSSTVLYKKSWKRKGYSVLTQGRCYTWHILYYRHPGKSIWLQDLIHTGEASALCDGLYNRKNGGEIETGWNNDGAGVCERVIGLDTRMRERKGERSAGKTDNEASGQGITALSLDFDYVKSVQIMRLIFHTKSTEWWLFFFQRL